MLRAGGAVALQVCYMVQAERFLPGLDAPPVPRSRCVPWSPLQRARTTKTESVSKRTAGARTRQRQPTLQPSHHSSSRAAFVRCPLVADCATKATGKEDGSAGAPAAGKRASVPKSAPQTRHACARKQRSACGEHIQVTLLVCGCAWAGQLPLSVAHRPAAVRFLNVAHAACSTESGRTHARCFRAHGASFTSVVASSCFRPSATVHVASTCGSARAFSSAPLDSRCVRTRVPASARRLGHDVVLSPPMHRVRASALLVCTAHTLAWRAAKCRTATLAS
jgi:hypothetical protein